MHVTLTSPQMVLACSFFCLAILPSISLCLLIVYFQATSKNFSILLCLLNVHLYSVFCPDFHWHFYLEKGMICAWLSEYVCGILPTLLPSGPSSPHDLQYTNAFSHAHLPKTPLHAEGKMSLLLLACERERCVGNKHSVKGIYSKCSCGIVEEMNRGGTSLKASWIERHLDTNTYMYIWSSS